MELTEKELGILGREIFFATMSLASSSKHVSVVKKRCRINGNLFTDVEFTPQMQSLLGYNTTDPRRKNWSRYVWRRVTEFSDPEQITVFGEQLVPMDIKQGALADTYLICAIGCLCERPELVYQLFHTKRVSQEGVYGIYLYINGIKKLFVIDDYIPCGSESTGPVFTTLKHNQLWMLLLEKVMAKAYGNYSLLEGESINDSLTDLTGAPCKLFTNFDNNIWDVLVNASANNYVIAASAGSTLSSKLMLESMGLLGGWAYAVLRTVELTTDQGNVKLLEIRNPWSKTEWKGDWSDHSDKWTVELAEKAGLTQEEDGKFFISVDDFSHYFTTLTICQVHTDYYFDSISFQQAQNKYKLLKLTVSEATHLFMIFSQPHKRYFSGQDHNYSAVGITLVKIHDYDNLEFLDSYYLEPNQKSVDKETNIEAGEYYISLMFFNSQHHSQYSFATYSKHHIEIEKVKRRSDFRQKVFTDYAYKHGTVTLYEDPNLQDCFRSQFFLPYRVCYIYIKNNSQTNALREICYFKKFKNLELLPPFTGSKYSITLEPGEDAFIGIRQTSKDYQLSYTIQAQHIISKTELLTKVKEAGQVSVRKDPRTGEELQIYLHTYKHDGGICYLYENNTTDIRLEEKITFRTEGLEMVGGDQEALDILLEPGENQFIEFRNVLPKWSMQTSVSYSISLNN